MGFLSVVFIVLLVLKLADVHNLGSLSWWAVFMPLIFEAVVDVSALVVMGMLSSKIMRPFR